MNKTRSNSLIYCHAISSRFKYPWVAFQSDNTEYMTSNTDGALFGNDNQVPNGYRDIYFGGIGSIFIDTSQDGKGAIEISSSNIVTVEFKKELDSEDSSGNDIQWIENNLYAIVIMIEMNSMKILEILIGG